jgi:hypothetical protein
MNTWLKNVKDGLVAAVQEVLERYRYTDKPKELTAELATIFRGETREDETTNDEHSPAPANDLPSGSDGISAQSAAEKAPRT